jgi:hypothetical protein
VDLWTIFVFGQYFSWVWILRRQVQYLKFSTDKRTQRLAKALGLIRDAFLSRANDKHRHYFMLWSGQQMAIGEVMSIADENSKELVCIGFAQFEARYSSGNEEDKKFRQWFKPIEDGIEHLKGHRVEAVFDRLARIQHLLLFLIEILDPKKLAVQSRIEPVRRRPSGCCCRSCEDIREESGGRRPVRHGQGDHEARRAGVV